MWTFLVIILLSSQDNWSSETPLPPSTISSSMASSNMPPLPPQTSALPPPEAPVTLVPTPSTYYTNLSLTYGHIPALQGLIPPSSLSFPSLSQQTYTTPTSLTATPLTATPSQVSSLLGVHPQAVVASRASFPTYQLTGQKQAMPVTQLYTSAQQVAGVRVPARSLASGVSQYTPPAKPVASYQPVMTTPHLPPRTYMPSMSQQTRSAPPSAHSSGNWMRH